MNTVSSAIKPWLALLGASSALLAETGRRRVGRFRGGVLHAHGRGRRAGSVPLKVKVSAQGAPREGEIPVPTTRTQRAGGDGIRPDLSWEAR